MDQTKRTKDETSFVNVQLGNKGFNGKAVMSWVQTTGFGRVS